MKQITKTEKLEITNQLETYLTVTKKSNNRFGNESGVSGANISNIRNGKWENVGDNIWRKVASACGYSFQNWVTGKIQNLIKINKLCETAQMNSASIGISFNAGSGKSHSFNYYRQHNENVFYIQVAFHWTRKMFFEQLATLLGIDPSGNTAAFLAELVIRKLKSFHKPLLIIDEADKLTESGMMFFITLYNELDGQCGIIMAGAPYLRHYIDKCARKDRRGYREIVSRIGTRWQEIYKINESDVREICQKNGLVDDQKINEIYNDSEGDLRRVKREIIKFKAQKQLKIAG